MITVALKRENTHSGCKRATISSSNLGYWIPKLHKKIERDQCTDLVLAALGWQILIIWECEVKSGAFRPILVEYLLDLKNIMTNLASVDTVQSTREAYR